MFSPSLIFYLWHSERLKNDKHVKINSQIAFLDLIVGSGAVER